MAAKAPVSKLVKILLPAAFWLAVWHMAAWVLELRLESRGNELLLPYPTTVLCSLTALWGTMPFWSAVLKSLLRILMGLVSGSIAGVALAVLTCSARWLDNLLAPAIRVVRATPVTSFILLILLWIGRDQVPAVIAGLMVLPVVWENLVQGIRATDLKLLEMAEAYGLQPIKRLYLIYFPTVRPYLAAAITTSMGLAWKSGVAAEVLCLPRQAIGTQIYNSKLYLEVPDLFAWTLTVVLLSIVLEKLLRLAVTRKRGGAVR